METIITSQMLVGALTKALDTAAGEAGRRGWEALVELIKKRRAKSQKSDGGAGQDVPPNTPEDVGRLADWLAAEAQEDPRFARELSDWRQAVVTVGSGQGDSVNSVSGSVHGSVVQGRDISGPISFG